MRQVLHRLFQAGSDQIAPLGRQMADEQLERGGLCGHPMLEVGRRHRQLVQVGRQGEFAGVLVETDRLGIRTHERPPCHHSDTVRAASRDSLSLSSPVLTAGNAPPIMA